MMRRAGILLLLAAAVAAEDVPKHEPGEEAPRGQVLEWTSRQKRPFQYRLPETIDPDRPANLLVMTHGTGMGYQWAFWNYPVTKGWRPDDIIVAPSAVAPKRGFYQAKPDETEVLDIVKLFKKRFPVGNVYIYGHSQGAFFSYWFAGEHPEIIDGVVGHAGRPLAFKFPKKAAQNQAVAILHCFSDPVVGVWCAYNADRRYRERKYQKVRLWVVEGVPENAGHWPLPFHVNVLLDWCDRKTIKSPAAALWVATRELGKESPDLAAVAEAVARGRELAKEPVERLEVLATWLERAQAAHLKELLPALMEHGKKPAYGSWAVHYRIADEAFSGFDLWKSSTKAMGKHVARHEKALSKAAKTLIVRRSSKTMANCLKGMREAFLAPGYEHFLVHVRGYIEKPDQGDRPPSEKERAAYDALIAEREPARKAGLEAANKITRDLVEWLRATHDWVPKPKS